MNLPEVGTVWRLRAFRNLKVGVHRGEGLFLGIREKFGDYDLYDDEFLRNENQLVEQLGKVPDDIKLACSDPFPEPNKKLFDFLKQWGLP